ncbi:hypothetical protein PHLGIDRAFT_107300 [Phlebiopsis gigantea 11061_1 CR5-6]|uniref:Phytase A n=1 Tax=Phlebiopsis gigantea (strain 11061_1 CR5-6) TaxID=745531 RepID=A0A0C3NM61_PHLG1|nr:hypothetical protein PHLGIDRAFT_107300 [Phlebiopsis gigantea 11061_1 CR5-6]
MVAGLTTLVALAALWSLVHTASVTKHTAPTFPIAEREQLNWAQYSPYIALAKYKQPPGSCKIDQLQRHGARYPTSGATTGIKAALAKIQSAKEFKDPALSFLKSFTYDLGNNDLVPFGAAQSFDAGVEAFERYSSLISSHNVPFVRSDSSERVVVTATNWTDGIASASGKVVVPKLDVILSSSGNDTLEDNCPAASTSDDQDEAWINTFAPPITARLNAAAPGANLTNDDVYSLISLCPFETVAKETKSAFCTLFESIPGAFEGFAYTGDLDKYYGTGYGNTLGRVQGVGYVNELLARLTGQPVRDHTQTNHTLDGAPATFPLNRTLYADFSHDNQMAAIFAALGLFAQRHALDPTRPDPARTWRASSLVPFSARMVVERLRCGGDKTKVRVFVQDVQMPLEFCEPDKDGLCLLDKFVESQSYARNDGEGDFEKCFANAT